MKDNNKGITVAGGNGKGGESNQLNEPGGICIDPEGNILIADTENHRIIFQTTIVEKE